MLPPFSIAHIRPVATLMTSCITHMERTTISILQPCFKSSYFIVVGMQLLYSWRNGVRMEGRFYLRRARLVYVAVENLDYVSTGPSVSLLLD